MVIVLWLPEHVICTVVCFIVLVIHIFIIKMCIQSLSMLFVYSYLLYMKMEYVKDTGTCPPLPEFCTE